MQQLRLPASLTVIVGFALAPTAASACTFPVRHYSDREIRQMAEEAVASATTIIDGEIISPMASDYGFKEGVLPVAYIKVSRTWKGHVEEDIAPVAYMSSCDLSLEVKGQKVRILLDGAGIYTADQEKNGRVAVYQHDAFNREIDRILGAPRPADFVDPGGPPPPEDQP